MDAGEAILTAIARCGSVYILEAAEKKQSLTACIQPRAYDTQLRTRGELSRFGRIDPRQFVYYGPLTEAGKLAREGTVLTGADGRFELLLCHDFSWQGQKLFRWAVARKLEGGGL